MIGAQMQTIFIQIKAELGKAYNVAEDAMENVSEVSEAYSTSGQFDLLLKCYLEDSDDVGRFVTERIQSIIGVKDTFTLITFKAFQFRISMNTAISFDAAELDTETPIGIDVATREFLRAKFRYSKDKT